MASFDPAPSLAGSTMRRRVSFFFLTAVTSIIKQIKSIDKSLLFISFLLHCAIVPTCKKCKKNYCKFDHNLHVEYLSWIKTFLLLVQFAEADNHGLWWCFWQSIRCRLVFYPLTIIHHLGASWTKKWNAGWTSPSVFVSRIWVLEFVLSRFRLELVMHILESSFDMLWQWQELKT